MAGIKSVSKTREDFEALSNSLPDMDNAEVDLDNPKLRPVSTEALLVIFSLVLADSRATRDNDDK